MESTGCAAINPLKNQLLVQRKVFYFISETTVFTTG
jgi:hypothetical protein